MRRILCMTALGAMMLVAQNRPGPAGRWGGQAPDPEQMAKMRVGMLAVRLKLTDGQKAQAETIFTDAARSSANLRANLRTANQGLHEAIRKNSGGEIESAAATVGTLTGQLAAINGKADAAFYQILTAEQKAAYDAMPPGGMGGGMGGPGAGRRGPRGQGQGQGQGQGWGGQQR